MHLRNKYDYVELGENLIVTCVMNYAERDIVYWDSKAQCTFKQSSSRTCPACMRHNFTVCGWNFAWRDVFLLLPIVQYPFRYSTSPICGWWISQRNLILLILIAQHPFRHSTHPYWNIRLSVVATFGSTGHVISSYGMHRRVHNTALSWSAGVLGVSATCRVFRVAHDDLRIFAGRRPRPRWKRQFCIVERHYCTLQCVVKFTLWSLRCEIYVVDVDLVKSLFMEKRSASEFICKSMSWFRLLCTARLVTRMWWKSRYTVSPCVRFYSWDIFCCWFSLCNIHFSVVCYT